MVGTELVLVGSLLMLVSAIYDYYQRGRRRSGQEEELDEELSELKEKDSIDPDELPAIGSSKENWKEELKLSAIGYLLGFLLILIGLLFPPNVGLRCFKALKYAGVWSLVVGFVGTFTWYAESRIFEWEYYPELRLILAVLVFIPNLMKELCSVGILN